MTKIEALFSALAKACSDDGSSLVVGISKNHELEHMEFVGRTDEMALINLVAADTICDLIEAKQCDCPGCQQAKKLLKREKSQNKKTKRPQIHIVDMMNEDPNIDDILQRIFGGGNRDNDQN